jgi:hypothetical protein
MRHLISITVILALFLVLASGCATRGQVQELEERVERAEKAAEKCKELFELQQYK